MAGWTPTRQAALGRLEGFLPHAGRSYAKLRNYDLGPGEHAHVSTLSPWIRHRVLLEEEVVSAVVGRHGFSAAEKFVQEVYWRTYWKGWLELRPAVWRTYRDRLRQLVDALDRDSELRARWQAATAARTGIDCFDAWCRELIETGYLHNHARMWFASIWIFTLDLPWQLGADFFLRHLLDGDPASNTLSWRWVAGLQARGKTYLARPDNIAKYTAGRFAPACGLATAAPPLEGSAPPAPLTPPQPAPWDQDPPTGLLLTEEDLHPDFLLAAERRYRSILAVKATERRSPLGVSSPVLDFVDGAIADAAGRIGEQGHTSMERARGRDPVEHIVDWARAAGVRQVVTAYVPVGPTSDALRPLAEQLAAHDIALIPALRRWDALAWPHATHGFFKFREKIPAILGRLQSPMESAA